MIIKTNLNIPKPNLARSERYNYVGVKLNKTKGPKSRINVVHRKLAFQIGEQIRSDDFLYNVRTKERLLNYMLISRQHNFAYFASLCRLFIKNLLTLKDPDLTYIVAHLKYIQLYFRNELYNFLYSKFPSFFKKLIDDFFPIKKSYHFFFKKKISLRNCFVTKKFAYQKKTTFCFILMHTKLNFILCRILQFYMAAFTKSLNFQSYYTTPKDCWFFFTDNNFERLSRIINYNSVNVKNIQQNNKQINEFNVFFREELLKTAELYVPFDFHEKTKLRIKSVFLKPLPFTNIQVKQLDCTNFFDSGENIKSSELLKRQYKFRYYLDWYFKMVFSLIRKEGQSIFFKTNPGPKPYPFEFVGTSDKFYYREDHVQPKLKKNQAFDFETFSTILPTPPPFLDVISSVQFDIDVFEDERKRLIDILLGDRSYIYFYNAIYGRKIKNITISEYSCYTIDNINKTNNTWFFIRQFWSKLSGKYTRYYGELNKWNFRQKQIPETLIEYFFCNIFSVTYMDPHLGRAVNHYRKLLDIEYTKNKYLDEIYDTLIPRMHYVEEKWNLIVEALDVFEGNKIFMWLKHTKTYYEPEPLIAPIFTRLHNVPKIDSFFFKYYYPIYEKFKTTVLPYTAFRTPHFGRKILISQDFAHNFHLQSFFRFARVLIKCGFKKRALRMLKFCLIHLKKKHICYSASNMLLGAVKIATPDLIAMPYKKGGRSEYSVIAARTIRHFSEAVRILYKGARFRRKHLDWGGDWFLGKKFEHVLAEEVVDVVKGKYDCMTMRIVRQLITDLTQLRRSHYTRKYGVVKYSPYDFVQDGLKHIFSKKSEQYQLRGEKEILPFRIKTKKNILFKDIDMKFKKMRKIHRLLYQKPQQKLVHTKRYGFGKTSKI